MLAFHPHGCKRPAPLPRHGPEGCTGSGAHRMDHPGAALAGKRKLYFQYVSYPIRRKAGAAPAKGELRLFIGPGRDHHEAP